METTSAYRQWVEQQFKEGKPLLGKFKNELSWQSVLDPGWDWNTFDYRIDTTPVTYRVIVNTKNQVVNLAYWNTDNHQSDISNMSDAEVLERADETLHDGPHRVVFLQEIVLKQCEDFETVRTLKL